LRQEEYVHGSPADRSPLFRIGIRGNELLVTVRKSRFMEERIVAILKEGEACVRVADLLRRYGNQSGELLRVAIEVCGPTHRKAGADEEAGGRKHEA
jgi:hypothetical protein